MVNGFEESIKSNFHASINPFSIIVHDLEAHGQTVFILKYSIFTILKGTLKNEAYLPKVQCINK